MESWFFSHLKKKKRLKMQSVLNKKHFSTSDMLFKMGCCLSLKVYLLLQGLGLVLMFFSNSCPALRTSGIKTLTEMLGRPGLFSRSIVQLTSSTSLQRSGDYFSTWRRTCTFWWDNAAIHYMNECCRKLYLNLTVKLVSFVNIYIFNCSQ